jgi:hypothetical protein
MARFLDHLPDEQRRVCTSCRHATGTFVVFPEDAIESSIPARFEHTAERSLQQISRPVSAAVWPCSSPTWRISQRMSSTNGQRAKIRRSRRSFTENSFPNYAAAASWVIVTSHDDHDYDSGDRLIKLNYGKVEYDHRYTAMVDLAEAELV